MVERPGEASLLAATDDAFKSSHLERMLTNLTASYKLYWLNGIFEEVRAGNSHMSFKSVAARMIASAWYPVVYYRLRLGATDQLAKCIEYLRLHLTVPAECSEAEIIETISSSDDAELNHLVRDLQHYVPYRLIRPFYQNELSRIRMERGALPDRAIDGEIFALNRAMQCGAPYVIDQSRQGLEVQQDWFEYFRSNDQVIRGWLDMKLVDYLQARNPSVPAISQKLHPPKKRNLAAVQRFWKDAIAVTHITDVYTGLPFDSDHFAALGPLSIDHFIPWSFVLHDEPWNLTPMFRDLNSSKNDKLPELNAYLTPFCEQQFNAVMVARQSSKHAKVIESYLEVDPHVFEYECSNASKESFSKAIRNAIVPLYQIASNQGFPVWEASFEYEVVGV